MKKNANIFLILILSFIMTFNLFAVSAFADESDKMANSAEEYTFEVPAADLQEDLAAEEEEPESLMEETGAPEEEPESQAEETGAPEEEPGSPMEETGAPEEEPESPMEETGAQEGEPESPAEETGATEEEESEMTEDPESEEMVLELEASGVEKGTVVSGTYPVVSDKEIATIRYYLNEEKTDYAFAEFFYNEAADKYEYSFEAPYDGFEIKEASSFDADDNATIIAEYYSLSKWDGAVDISWYNESDRDFYLEYPAQLAGFAAIVNGSVDGSIHDYQVKGERKSPADRTVNRGLPDYIESNLQGDDTLLIAGVKGQAWKGVPKHDFTDRTVHLMADMDMGGVPGDQIDHSLNTNRDVYKAKNAYDYPNWTPIGGEYLMDVSDPDSMIIAFFNGTIEGHGHYVNNLYCFRWAYASVGETAYGYAQGTGFVGCMGAKYKEEEEKEPEIVPAIRNLGLSGYIYGRRMVGGFVGCVGGGSNAAEHSLSVECGIRLENLVNHADVYCTDSKGIAGIVACSMAKGSVVNCYNTGNLYSSYGYPTGGIIGSNEGMDVFCCYNTGSVTSSTKNGRGIGSNNGGSNYTVDNCYYLEGSGDDLNYPGYYDYVHAVSVSIRVEAMTEEQMKDGTLLEALNGNGEAYVEGAEGYPVLYWEKMAGTGNLSVEQPEGGSISAEQTGIIDNGTVVYLSNEAETGWKFRYYSLNGKPVTGDYVTVNGDCNVSAMLESVKPGVLKIAPNSVCDITVTKNGIIFDEQGNAQEVKNYPVSQGDPLYEGDLLIVDATVKAGKVPEDESLQYSATADLAVPFTYEYIYTGKPAETTSVKTYKVTSAINEEEVYLTLNVIPLTTQKLWRYIGDVSWYDDTKQTFTLTNAEQLAGLQKLVNEGTDFSGKTVQLGKDISLVNTDGTSGIRYWDGIGTNAHPFAGIFDGKNHKITDYQGSLKGLFANVYGTSENRAAIKNLEIYGTSSSVEAAGLVSRAKYADIENCGSFCSVKNGAGWSGGIVSYALAGVTVRDCINYGKIEGLSKIGGIVGELSADSSVLNCVNYGDIYCFNTGGNSIGGIAGSLNGQLTSCANYGNIEAWGRSVGGITGQSVSTKAQITGCYNVGTVSLTNSSQSSDCAGGIIGFGSFYNIIDSFNYGAIHTDITLAGGIVGKEARKSTSSTSNVYYLDSSCAYAEAGTPYEGLPVASYTAGMKKASAEEFASAGKVLKNINSSGFFELINQIYPELKEMSSIHTHTGGTATCRAFAVCEICGLEYGNYDSTTHLHTETRNYRHAVWVNDGYTGDLYCKDCDTLIEEGEPIAADLGRQAMEVDYKYEDQLVKTRLYSVAEFDALKTSGKFGYSYGYDKNGNLVKTKMAVTEGVLITDLIKKEGLGIDDINSITIYYGGNKDTVSTKKLKENIFYYDADGTRSDAPALLGITYYITEGRLDEVAAAAESMDELRFAYGISEDEFDSKASVGGRRMVSPVNKIEVNVKEDQSSIQGLEVTTPPINTAYHAGDVFLADNMEISAVLKDGTKQIVTDYSIDKQRALSPDDTYVTVLYDWKTVTIPITVTAHNYNEDTGICEENRHDGSKCGQKADVDTDELTAVIAKAKEAFSDIAVSKDGTDCYPSEYWVTSEQADALQKVVKEAEELLESASITQKKADAMADRVISATNIFNLAKQVGTKVDIIPVSDMNIVLSFKSATYTGKAIKPAVTVKTAEGKELVKGTDYSVSYQDNVNAGTAKVVIKGKGIYQGSAESRFTIKPKKVVPTVVLSKSKITYTGKAVKPSVVVKADGKTLDKSSYSLSYASGRINPGTYWVKVTLKGNFSGSGKKTFTIVPKGVASFSVKAARKAFTVKWSKQTKQTTGYQIQYSLKKNFKSGTKTITVSNNKTISKKISKLKSGKTYYVRIRTYKKISGKSYYSDWTGIKKIKVR